MHVGERRSVFLCEVRDVCTTEHAERHGVLEVLEDSTGRSPALTRDIRDAASLTQHRNRTLPTLLRNASARTGRPRVMLRSIPTRASRPLASAELLLGPA